MPTIIDRFHETAFRHADALALITDDEALTYKALCIRLDQIASTIDSWYRETLGREVQAGDVIGICLEKSTDLYASILAILAVGASYVPIDPQLGPDAQGHILVNCRCELVIARHGTLTATVGVGQIAPTSVPRETCADMAPPISRGRAEAMDECYTIFTSGSTGRPKGVQIHHQNLLNLVAWVHKEFRLGSDSRVMQYSTINFDASVLDIFPTLLSGAALCIPGQEQRLSEAQLADFCMRHQVKHAFLPPSLLAVLDAERFPTLQTVLTGGEACSTPALRAWASNRSIYNLYGPTECTVLVSFKRMDADTSPTNIGQAISGVRLHVLDENMRPTRRGELHVAGLCVSPGYLGDQDATERKFLSCPQVDRDTLYKTGDIVERDNHGDLHFIGRVDRQVKVRGYRIELEEIEGALMAVGCVQAAVKLTCQGALVAYFAAPAGLSSTSLRDRLAPILSDYKIPQFFVEMVRLPYKPSGKVDYEALPVHQELTPIWPDVGPAPNGDDTSIHEMWAEALNVHPSTLHPQSNFRDLGGTSLGIVCLLSKIETQFGVRISFLKFLEDPTPSFVQRTLQHHERSTSSQTEPHRPDRPQHR